MGIISIRIEDKLVAWDDEVPLSVIQDANSLAHVDGDKAEQLDEITAKLITAQACYVHKQCWHMTMDLETCDLHLHNYCTYGYTCAKLQIEMFNH